MKIVETPDGMCEQTVFPSGVIVNVLTGPNVEYEKRREKDQKYDDTHEPDNSETPKEEKLKDIEKRLKDLEDKK